MLRARRSRLSFVMAVLAALIVLPGFAGVTDAATSKWTPRCDDVRVRTAPRVSARTLKTIDEGAVVTVAKIVREGRWEIRCHGRDTGRNWLKIVAINGKTTEKLFGRNAVFAARGLFRIVPAPTPPPTPDPTPVPPPPSTSVDMVTNCSVRLRTSASTDADTAAIIDDNSVVSASGTVTGGSWEADCGSSVSGNSWFKVTHVGGQSVSALYGVSVVYAASGLFRSVGTSSSWIEGIDVSHWQGNIDWPMVRAAGKKFVIAKSTEGVGFKDDKYDRNKAGAMGQGLKFGAYHFARPENDPLREADWFVNNSDYERGMLIPTLDLERTGGRGPTSLTNWVKAWMARVTDRLGVKPMIYVSPSFWRANLNDTRWFADNGYDVLWVAHWGTSSPSVPASNWGGNSWTFWQYTSDGRVPGISGRVDLNRYRHDSFSAVTY